MAGDNSCKLFFKSRGKFSSYSVASWFQEVTMHFISMPTIVLICFRYALIISTLMFSCLSFAAAKCMTKCGGLNYCTWC